MLHLWLSWPGRLLASTSLPPLPAPEISIYSRSEDTVVLACRAPQGHQVVLFLLHRRYGNQVSFPVCEFLPGCSPSQRRWLQILPSSCLVSSFLLLPLRWTPRSSRPKLMRPSSLWGFCRPTQPSLNSSAVCSRAKRVVTALSVHICSWSGKKVHIKFYL